MQRTSFEDVTCSVAQCLDVVGEWWSLLIVRDAFLGVTRFDDFQARLGISRNILTQRLNHLVDHEILRRVPYSDHPPRSEYRLTAKGRDLWHVVTAMRQWGDRWAAPGGPPLTIRHTACGHVVTAVPACSQCGEPLDARSVTAIPGPGASAGDFDRTALAASAVLADAGGGTRSPVRGPDGPLSDPIESMWARASITLGLMEVPIALAERTVLVLLSQRPAHGFAVAQLTAPDGELGRIWRIPRPVVYRAIGRLLDAGLITPESVEPGLGPQRTIYTVTARGRQEADHWLSTPVEHVRDIRSHLLIKLALLYRAGRDPAELLRRQRAALEPIARAVQAPRDQLDGFDEILLAWRRATAAAALGFLDEIAARTEAWRS